MSGGLHMKKKIKMVLLLLSLLIILIIIPFVIEKIILCEKVFPFNIAINFSKEVWFGFIASYLGAVGTVLLGVIALYQNKKYKELSDSSERKLMELQNEIKILTEKSVYLIELNSKIEQAKYYPILTDLKDIYWDLKEENLEKYFNLEKDVFQVSYKEENPEKTMGGYKEAFKHYHTFMYTLKNDGESTIRNFRCTSIIKNNQKKEMGAWIFESCDIEPGAVLRCVYATKFDIFEECKNGKIETLTFIYEMENVLGDHFKMSNDIYFYSSQNKEWPNEIMEISPIEMQ